MRGTIHLNKRTDLKEEYEDAKKIRNVKKIVWITADVLYAAVYGIVHRGKCRSGADSPGRYYVYEYQTMAGRKCELHRV